MRRAPVAAWVAIGVVVLCAGACGGGGGGGRGEHAAASPPARTAASPAASSAVGASSGGAGGGDRDRDHDGIPNECDACPDEPETFNGICDEDGCPDIPVDSFGEGIITLQPVLLFDKQSSKLSGVSQPLVEQVAHAMTTNREALERVAVVGHASGDEADADATSLARAVAVKQALVRLGADDAHLEVHGVGARKPSADPDPSLNRRVEFVVMGSQGHEQYRWQGDAAEPVQAPHGPVRPTCRPVPSTCTRHP